jgi:hypothetical protein
MDIAKMITTVQLYIGIRKGVDVDISINSTNDLLLLSKAYSCATNWMNRNNVQIAKA